MGLFHNSYESAGAGIAKDEPKKKPFFRFWEIVWRKLGKLVGVNLVYTLFLLPGLIGIISLFTMKSEKLSYLMAGFCLLVQAILIGPSMAGMTKVLRNFSQERHAYVWYDYITALKRNFKQSVVVGVFDSVMLVCVACGVYVYPQLISSMNNNLIYVPFVLMYTVALHCSEEKHPHHCAFSAGDRGVCIPVLCEFLLPVPAALSAHEFSVADGLLQLLSGDPEAGHQSLL